MRPGKYPRIRYARNQVDPEPEFEVVLSYLLAVCYERARLIEARVEIDNDVENEQRVNDCFKIKCEVVRRHLERYAHRQRDALVHDRCKKREVPNCAYR